MFYSLHEMINTLIEQQRNQNFEFSASAAQGLIAAAQKGDTVGFLGYLDQPLQSLLLFLSPEGFLFTGLFILIFQIGFYINQTSSKALMQMLIRSSAMLLDFAIISLVYQCVLLYFGDTYIFENFFIFNGTFKFDLYTQSSKLVLLVVLRVLYIFSKVFGLVSNTINAAELPLLLHTCAFLSLLILSCNHFALLLLALEGLSLAIYIMTTLDRSQGGIIAAVKYFVFGTLGSIFLFWGVANIYSLLPSLHFSSVFFFVNYISGDSQPIGALLHPAEFASSLILIGFLIKLGGAPLHQWVADVYSGSHTIVTLFFATFIKFVLFISFIKVAYNLGYSTVVDVFALASLIVGTLLTLRQLEIKRFLAYSSITHVGFLLIGDWSASVVYLLVYILSSILFFSVLLTNSTYGKELVYLGDLGAVKKSGYFNVVLLVCSLASMAGLPPMSGFFGKFLIWTNLLEDIYLFNNLSSYAFLVVSIALSLVTIFYYVRLISYIFLDDDQLHIRGVISNSFILGGSGTATVPIINAQIFILVLIVFWALVQGFVLGYTDILGFLL